LAHGSWWFFESRVDEFDHPWPLALLAAISPITNEQLTQGAHSCSWRKGLQDLHTGPAFARKQLNGPIQTLTMGSMRRSAWWRTLTRPMVEHQSGQQRISSESVKLLESIEGSWLRSLCIRRCTMQTETCREYIHHWKPTCTPQEMDLDKVVIWETSTIETLCQNCAMCILD
jgi:hypothetical protein